MNVCMRERERARGRGREAERQRGREAARQRGSEAARQRRDGDKDKSRETDDMRRYKHKRTEDHFQVYRHHEHRHHRPRGVPPACQSSWHLFSLQRLGNFKSQPNLLQTDCLHELLLGHCLELGFEQCLVPILRFRHWLDLFQSSESELHA